VSGRAWRRGALAATAGLALSACDLLMTEPAPPTSELTLAFQIVATPIGGTDEAFAKVNRIFLRLQRADQLSRDTVLFVRPTDGRVRTGLVLETEERIAALGIFAQLGFGTLPLFQGSGIVQIEPGVPTTADIPLTPVPASVVAGQQAITLSLLPPGTSAQLSSAVLYATTDTIDGLAGVWTSADPTIVAVSPGGLAVAQGRGTTDLVVTFAGLTDTVLATVQ
jgi:hypothetical protein